MPLSTILIVILVLILIGVFPGWGYNRGWAAGPYGYAPFGGVGLILIILLILLLTGWRS
jgi:hypothetical protein